MKIADVSIVTVASREYLPLVAVLADSLRRHHPEHRLTCYLAEATVEPDDTFGGRFDIRGIGELPLPDPAFTFQYTAFELCCALKPWCILDQLVRHNAAGVVYLDADMYVCAPFLEAVAAEWEAHPVLVTPHILDPGKETAFSFFLKAGINNAGFIAARNAAPGLEMLRWWQARLAKECYQDYLGGVFVDQRWLDLAAAIFGAVGPLTVPGINVGHWNLHEHDFAEPDGCIAVAPDEPLRIFHFSSFQNPGLTRHENIIRHIPPQVQRLADDYERALEARRSQRPGTPPYSFGRFTDGSEITPAMREAVRQGRVTVDDPFSAREQVVATLPPGDPDAVLEVREDHRVYRLQERCNLFEIQLQGTRRQLDDARAHMRRIRQHPVIGRILRMWNKYVNKDL